MLYGLVLIAGGFALFAMGVNLLSAMLSLAGALFYILVYTKWLKRNSTQNIVIGGAAGAIPPLVGWAAVTGSLALPAWYMFIIIFFWTPPHFWALSLLLKKDYEAANVPMYPVVFGEAETQRMIFLYTVAVVLLTFAFALSADVLGWLYIGTALGAGSLFIWFAAKLMLEANRKNARKLFLFSMLYLAVIFLAVMIDSSVTL
jgi:protoheme IX farnesyltransferase